MSDSGERRTQSRLEKQPERKHPFVPEQYGGLIRGTSHNTKLPHAVKRSSITYFRGKFVPKTNLKKSIDLMSRKDIYQLIIRAKILARHSAENELSKVSESTWESDIRSDLFGLMREDPHLRLDKTPYKYKYTDPDTLGPTIQKRYPDITFGLATFWNVAVQHQIRERNGEITCGRNHVGVHRSLTKERIFKQLFHRRCGLVVDPRWGAVDLIFPWAIYEAKKSSAPLKDAERQLYEGASIYLAMLDDLARDPKSPDRYQEGGANGPQLFGFASSGGMLWIYTIFGWYGDYIVKPLWNGNLSKSANALTALFIIDQLHNFAVTKHRDFVIKHLEPWLQLAEEELDSVCDDNDGWGPDDLASPSFRKQILNSGYYKSQSVPLWKELEDAAQLVISTKRNETRNTQRNKRKRTAEE